MRASLGDARRALNLSNKEMANFEANYMTWLRALVDMIERGGGAPGGKRERREFPQHPARPLSRDELIEVQS